MLKLKLQYFGHLMQNLKRPRCWERLRAGGEVDDRLDGITDSMDMGLSKLQEIMKGRKPGVLQSVGSQRVGHN